MLQQLQQQDPVSVLNEMVQIATNTFYNSEQEKEAKGQEGERRKETRHAQMLAALQGSPMVNPDSLKDNAQGKCLICKQVVCWAKECPKLSLNGLLQMPSTGTLDSPLPWGPKSLKIKHQAFPHDCSTGLK